MKLLEIIRVQTEVVQQGTNLSSIMDLVTQRTQQVTGADGACVELVEKKGLVYSAASGIANNFLGLRLNIENSLSGACIKERVPLISNDIEKDSRVNKNACRQIGLHSMIVVPLICENKAVGVIKVLSRVVDHFNDDHIRILELMSGLIAAAMLSAMRNEESELLHQATYDSLTGISNRFLFYDRLRQKLSRALEENESFGVLSLDMDGLKEINDDCGHRAGDAAIKEVALRIGRALRKSDMVSRLGGDEFGIIVMAVSDQDSLKALARKIGHAIEKTFEFEGREIKLRASVGCALFREDGVTLDALLEKADKAMYAMKRERKGLDNVR